MFKKMSNHHLKLLILGFMITSGALTSCIAINDGQLIDGPNLANKSLINYESITRSGNRSEFKNNDLWSMVAAMRGDSGSDSVAEYNKLDDGSHVKYEWHVKLDEANKYSLDWTVDYGANEVIFSLIVNKSASQFAPGSDIFALGFSAYGQFESTDFCIIWYDLGHRLHLQDARTDSKGKLKLVSESQSGCQLLYSNQQEPVAHRRQHHRRGEVQNESEEYSRDKSKNFDVKRMDPSGDEELARFKRPLDMCENGESMNYYRIDNGTTHLVWFTIKGPLLAIENLDLNKLMMTEDGSKLVDRKATTTTVEHHHRETRTTPAANSFEFGLKRVQLIATKPNRHHHHNYHRNEEAKSHAVKSLSHDIRMHRFEIPARETTYWCKLFKLPRKFESRKYHITKYEAVIETGNEHVVHHMELFNCANLNTRQEQELAQIEEQLGGWQGDCSGPRRPAATQPCRKVIMAWAMGAHPLEYPEQVGQAIGGENYSPYVVLEVHYNNVQSQAGLIDSSGLRFHYSAKLRPHDAGVLEVGLEYTDKNSIPPKMLAPLAGYCVSECTRVAMSPSGRQTIASTGEQQKPDQETTDEPKGEGIYIFAAQMHTHLVGTASWTEQVREGKVIGEVQRDNHYSSHFQEIRLLPEPVHVAPGDALIHYCLYDTNKRSNITLGGYATTDEMCVTYLHYYPRIELEVCKSSVDTEALEAYFAYLADEESQRTSKRLAERIVSSGLSEDGATAKTVADNYRSIEWSPRRSKELLEFYATAPLSVQCNKSDGDRFPGFWNGIPPTRVWQPMKISSRESPWARAQLDGNELAAYRGRNSSLASGRHAQCLSMKHVG